MYEYRATLRRVIDGDTIDVLVDLGLSIHTHQRLRLYGINAPEMRGAEREAGQAAKEWLASQLDSAEGGLVINTIQDKAGKFGRYLAYVYSFGGATSVNDQMVQEGHAVEAKYR